MPLPENPIHTPVRGRDPEAQAYQLRQDDVPEANVYRDVGVSGGTGTNSRAGWRALDARLQTGDTLVVVAADRIGRSWLNTVNTIRDLRTRGGKNTVPCTRRNHLGILA